MRWVMIGSGGTLGPSHQHTRLLAWVENRQATAEKTVQDTGAELGGEINVAQGIARRKSTQGIMVE